MYPNCLHLLTRGGFLTRRTARILSEIKHNLCEIFGDSLKYHHNIKNKNKIVVENIALNFYLRGRGGPREYVKFVRHF